jgi:hypothetical protein
MATPVTSKPWVEQRRVDLDRNEMIIFGNEHFA